MNIVYTFKHMKSSESVIDFSKAHIVNPSLKLLGDSIQLTLIFDGPQPDFCVNSLLTAPNGSLFKVKETGKNMYACIDAAGKKLVRMIRKDKTLHTNHKNYRRTLVSPLAEETAEDYDLEDKELAELAASDKAEIFVGSLGKRGANPFSSSP